jgi:hypothetical protein
MPGPVFIVPSERIEDFEAELEVIGERSQHLEPVLQDIVDKILERNRRMYETRGATSGVYWTPLRGSTITRKQNLGVSHPFDPLRRFNDLMKSLSVRGAEHQELDVDDDGIRLASTHPAAGYHASGTRKMPRRPPMVIAAKHAHEYVGDLNDFIFGEENG